MLWISEIDLAASIPHIQMGVRKLKDQQWLIQDELREEELRLKAELSKDEEVSEETEEELQEA